MIFVFCFFAAVLIYFSYQSWRGGVNYLNFFRRELAKPPSDFTPFATVFAPCRGIDDELETNLSALFHQNYPRYEIIFVVDSADDEAVSVIEKIIHHRDTETQRKEIYKTEKSSKKISVSLCLCGKNPASAKLVIAGKAADESQKVHNLREAVTHVSDESEVFVFVDSDARPNGNWLRNLTAPLEDENVGAATGYRWFIARKRSFATEMRSVWNASIASALGENKAKNFVWGGSTAMRRTIFEKLEIREKWRGTLSDDFAVTRVLKSANLSVYFVPQALTASVENCSWRALFEFTTRQMKITRVYAESLWIQSFLGAGLFNLVFVWAIFNLFFYPANSFSFRVSLVSLLIICAFSTGKSFLRLQAVKLILTDYENALKKQFWTQNTFWIFSPAIYFYNCLCALLSRKIVWRGIGYELKSPHETIVLEENTTKK